MQRLGSGGDLAQVGVFQVHTFDFRGGIAIQETPRSQLTSLRDRMAPHYRRRGANMKPA